MQQVANRDVMEGIKEELEWIYMIDSKHIEKNSEELKIF